MGKHKSTSNNKLAGGLLLGAVASGSLAVAALSGAGTASAGCVSISGTTFSSGGGGLCATSSEVGNLAVANGNTHRGSRFGGPGNIAIAASQGSGAALATAEGGGNFALANGISGNNNGAVFGAFPPVPAGSIDIPANANTPTTAVALGVLNKAFAIGNGSTAQAYNFDSPASTVGGNRATTIGNGSNSLAISGNMFTPQSPPGRSRTRLATIRIRSTRRDRRRR